MGRSQRSRLENSQSSQKTMSDDQIDSAVLKVTTFILCDMRALRKIRKEDVVTNALNGSAKQYTAIIKRVKANLLQIFGLLIVHLPDKEDFIIINKHGKLFKELTSEAESASDEDIQDNLILTVVLASIFMNRGQIFESHLITLLDTVGFLDNKFYGSSSVRSKMNDHVIKLVKQVFVKQMYLEATTIDRPEQVQNPPLPDNDRKVTVYQWGYRALLEVDVDKIVDYLIKMYDGEKPSSFPTSHHKDIKARQVFLRSEMIGRS